MIASRKRALVDAQAKAFHKSNPEVWTLFVKYTFEVIVSGFKHYSANAIMHRIRWHAEIETSEYMFKLNNNYNSRYARAFHKAYPEHKGFFRNRRLNK